MDDWLTASQSLEAVRLAASLVARIPAAVERANLALEATGGSPYRGAREDQGSPDAARAREVDELEALHKTAQVTGRLEVELDD